MEKHFRVRLASKNLALSGILDCLIKVKDEYVPVEYKYSDPGNSLPFKSHRYQVIAYAMLIEDKFKTKVNRGFVYYVPTQAVAEVKVTLEAKKTVERKLLEIRSMISGESMPKPQSRARKCLGCGYYNSICRRI